MLMQPHLAHNLPLIVTALQSPFNAPVQILFDNGHAFNIDCGDTSYCIVHSSDGPETYDDANDAIAQLILAPDCIAVTIVRANDNDTRNDIILYTVEPITVIVA